MVQPYVIMGKKMSKEVLALSKRRFMIGGWLLVLLCVAACSGNSNEPMKLPPEPTPEEVLHDLQTDTSSLLGLPVGAQRGEQFPLLELVVEDEEMNFTTSENSVTAEVTAYVGDREWKSVDKKTISVVYALNDLGTWQYSGLNIGDSIVAVAARQALFSSELPTP